MTDLSKLLSTLGINSDALHDLQLAKLKKLLLYTSRNSAYYREKFATAGVDPESFASLEQFAAYPLFDKYEERDSQARSLEELGHPLGMHLCCDIRDVNRISASSGTSGTPSFQGHTSHDRDVILENFSRLAEVVGVVPGDRVMMAGVMSMWVAGIPTVDALLNFGANVIPIGGLVGSEKVLEMIGLTRPEVLVGTPSFIRRLVARAGSGGDLDLASAGVRKLFVYGEPGGSVPEIVKELSAGFGGAEVFDMAGGTGCLNPIFVSCKAQSGMHFIAPDYAYIELYDRAADRVLPFEDGAEGEFVYTGLDRECGPLVRFADGDRMRVTLETCECGLPGMRVAILGRVDDMLLIKGVNVFPSAIRDLVMSFDDAVTGSVRVVRTGDSPVVEPPLSIKVECRGDPDTDSRDQLKRRIEERIQRQLRFRADVTLFREGDLVAEYGATGKVKILEQAARDQA